MMHRRTCVYVRYYMCVNITCLPGNKTVGMVGMVGMVVGAGHRGGYTGTDVDGHVGSRPSVSPPRPGRRGGSGPGGARPARRYRPSRRQRQHPSTALALMIPPCRVCPAARDGGLAPRTPSPVPTQSPTHPYTIARVTRVARSARKGGGQRADERQACPDPRRRQ